MMNRIGLLALILAVFFLAPLAVAQTTPTLDERVAALETRVSLLEGTQVPAPSATPTSPPATATATLAAMPPTATSTSTPIPPTATLIPTVTATLAPAVTLTPAAGQPCPGWYHDAITATGPDGQQYPTWHPAVDVATGCRFGHEHGDDPRTSLANSALPAFGYISAQAGMNEPHTGFKVFVQNASARNNDGRTLSHHARIVFHMGTSGPNRFGTRFHSLQYDFVQVGADAAGSGHEVHLLGMADTGSVSSICAQPRAAKTVMVLPSQCATDSNYEIWSAELRVGRATAVIAAATFDPITAMDETDHTRLVLMVDAYPSRPGPYLDCNREAYSGPVYYYNRFGPTVFRTDAYGVPQANGPLQQMVSQHDDLGVKMTTDGTQTQAKLDSYRCAPGLVSPN